MKRLKVQSNEEGAVMPRRRSPRLHLQTHAGPHIHASDEGAAMVGRRRCRRTSSEAPASLLDNEDMLWEILLRLPSQPSSLLRASAVCKRWRRLVNDPQFLGHFRTHHRTPPLLGAFVCRRPHMATEFAPILGPTDCIPPERFDLGSCSKWPADRHLLDCRHGRVLVKDDLKHEVVVCDPIRGEHRRMSIPPVFKNTRAYIHGAVLCAAADDHDHVHGSCHSTSFKVALLSMYRQDRRPVACLYSSETDTWGNLITVVEPCEPPGFLIPVTLIGNVLYWSILEFDFDRQSLAMIKGPSGINKLHRFHIIIKTEDGGVGLAVLSTPRIRIWQRKVNCEGASTWLLQKTIGMNKILRISPRIKRNMGRLMGYDEDTDEICLHIYGSVYMVQLKSMQYRKLYKTNYYTNYYPFKSFYVSAPTAGCGGLKGCPVR
ncbi:hypothetical protein VPH35_048681 [Triticum aestivum]|uniref:F-box domain-containing protein n=1 Tax=Triticum turgidum subsp. durum TaxID=4567 RepID=A0A9R1Q4W2_TRITD|nr:unnamed protein product [Triticum turgidum subsp. durum]